MNVFCNNALPGPSPGEEYPSAWANIMMLLASGQDFYNQNSYTFGVTYNGLIMILHLHYLLQHLYVLI